MTSVEFTRAQLAALTGLPPSSLTRALGRFPAARSGRGRYDASDSAFAAWLAQHQGGDAAAAPPTDHVPRAVNHETGTVFVVPPSGVPLATVAIWRTLRSATEPEALGMLDWLIGCWRLSPHPNVPDLLSRMPMSTPAGFQINKLQWQALRGRNARAALSALDVLIRSWRPESERATTAKSPSKSRIAAVLPNAGGAS